MSKNSSTVACILCRGNVFTEPLPSNDKRHTHTHRLMGGVYEVAVKMGSVAVTYVVQAFKSWWEGGFTDTDSIEIAKTIFIFFFKIRKVGWDRCKGTAYAFSHMTHLDYVTVEKKLAVTLQIIGYLIPNKSETIWPTEPVSTKSTFRTCGCNTRTVIVLKIPSIQFHFEGQHSQSSEI
jgi:hypothetical protein